MGDHVSFQNRLRAFGAVILLTCMLPVFAQDEFMQKTKHVYLAMDLGNYQATINQTYAPPANSSAPSVVMPALQNGYALGGAVGYSTPLTSLYLLGGELSARFMTSYARLSHAIVTATLTDVTKAKYNIDLSLVPGVMLTETIAAYLKIGVSWAYFTDNLSTLSGVFIVPTSYASSGHQFGFNASLGIKRYISQCSYLFAEYRYHAYGSVGFAGFTRFTANYAHSARIFDNSVLMGVGYHFA